MQKNAYLCGIELRIMESCNYITFSLLVDGNDFLSAGVTLFDGLQLVDVQR